VARPAILGSPLTPHTAFPRRLVLAVPVLVLRTLPVRVVPTVVPAIRPPRRQFKTIGHPFVPGGLSAIRSEARPRTRHHRFDCPHVPIGPSAVDQRAPRPERSCHDAQTAGHPRHAPRPSDDPSPRRCTRRRNTPDSGFGVHPLPPPPPPLHLVSLVPRTSTHQSRHPVPPRPFISVVRPHRHRARPDGRRHASSAVFPTHFGRRHPPCPGRRAPPTTADSVVGQLCHRHCRFGVSSACGCRRTADGIAIPRGGGSCTAAARSCVCPPPGPRPPRSPRPPCPFPCSCRLPCRIQSHRLHAAVHGCLCGCRPRDPDPATAAAPQTPIRLGSQATASRRHSGSWHRRRCWRVHRLVGAAVGGCGDSRGGVVRGDGGGIPGGGTWCGRCGGGNRWGGWWRATTGACGRWAGGQGHGTHLLSARQQNRCQGAGLDGRDERRGGDYRPQQRRQAWGEEVRVPPDGGGDARDGTRNGVCRGARSNSTSGTWGVARGGARCDARGGACSSACGSPRCRAGYSAWCSTRHSASNSGPGR